LARHADSYNHGGIERSIFSIIIRAKLLPLKRINRILDEAEQPGNIMGQSVVTAKKTPAKKRSREDVALFAICHLQFSICNAFPWRREHETFILLVASLV